MPSSSHLNNAVVFDSIEKVTNAISNLPEWAKENHIPYKLNKYQKIFMKQAP